MERYEKIDVDEKWSREYMGQEWSISWLFGFGNLVWLVRQEITEFMI